LGGRVLIRVWTKVLVAEVTLIEGLRKKPKSVVPPSACQNKKTNVVVHPVHDCFREAPAAVPWRN
jgi:hypothetical protein